MSHDNYDSSRNQVSSSTFKKAYHKNKKKSSNVRHVERSNGESEISDVEGTRDLNNAFHEWSVFYINSVSDKKDSPTEVFVNFFGKPVRMQVDTGSAKSLMSFKEYKENFHVINHCKREECSLQP